MQDAEAELAAARPGRAAFRVRSKQTPKEDKKDDEDNEAGSPGDDFAGLGPR